MICHLFQELVCICDNFRISNVMWYVVTFKQHQYMWLSALVIIYVVEIPGNMSLYSENSICSCLVHCFPVSIFHLM
jgi:hypothetical protein